MKKLQDEETQNVYCMLIIIKGNKIQVDEVGGVRNTRGKKQKHI